MDEEWERIWKEAAIALPTYYPGTCKVGLSKTMKDHREMIDDSAEMRTGHIPKTIFTGAPSYTLPKFVKYVCMCMYVVCVDASLLNETSLVQNRRL